MYGDKTMPNKFDRIKIKIPFELIKKFDKDIIQRTTKSDTEGNLTFDYYQHLQKNDKKGKFLGITNIYYPTNGKYLHLDILSKILGKRMPELLWEDTIYTALNIPRELGLLNYNLDEVYEKSLLQNCEITTDIFANDPKPYILALTLHGNNKKMKAVDYETTGVTLIKGQIDSYTKIKILATLYDKAVEYLLPRNDNIRKIAGPGAFKNKMRFELKADDDRLTSIFKIPKKELFLRKIMESDINANLKFLEAQKFCDRRIDKLIKIESTIPPHFQKLEIKGLVSYMEECSWDKSRVKEILNYDKMNHSKKKRLEEELNYIISTEKSESVSYLNLLMEHIEKHFRILYK